MPDHAPKSRTNYSKSRLESNAVQTHIPSIQLGMMVHVYVFNVSPLHKHITIYHCVVFVCLICVWQMQGTGEELDDLR